MVQCVHVSLYVGASQETGNGLSGCLAETELSECEI